MATTKDCGRTEVFSGLQRMQAGQTDQSRKLLRNPFVTRCEPSADGDGNIAREKTLASLSMSYEGASLVVQWLRFHAPNAGGLGSIPRWGA